MNLLDNFSIDRFLYSLRYMWQGMLCIFIVIAVIIASVYILGYFSAKAEEKKKQKEAEAQSGDGSEQ